MSGLFNETVPAPAVNAAENALAMEIKETLAPVFEKMRPRIAVAYLFGSSATGDAGPKSDIDVAVLFHSGGIEADFETRLELYADCSRALKRNDVDIVVLNRARNLFLLDSVVRNGIVLFEGDPELREEYEVRVMHDFIDFREHRIRVMGV
jgi:predicted nucleotidyltransferase